MLNRGSFRPASTRTTERDINEAVLRCDKPIRSHKVPPFTAINKSENFFFEFFKCGLVEIGESDGIIVFPEVVCASSNTESSAFHGAPCLWRGFFRQYLVNMFDTSKCKTVSYLR